MAKKIYIGKLSANTTIDQLEKHFSQVGTVISTKIANTANFSANSGYGYVVMSNEEETKTAIRQLNNSTLEGSKIQVMEAHSLDQDRPFTYAKRTRKY